MIGFTRLEIHAADHCTQACAHCSHAADLADPRVYRWEEYSPWLNNMSRHGIQWEAIDILGGEPFISPHLGPLAEILRQYTPRLGIMSNLYWLTSEESIAKRDQILRNIDSMVVTYYRPIVTRLGGLEEIQRLLEIIRSRYGIHVWHFNPGIVDAFATFEFHQDPRPIVSPECNFRDCVQLLADGRLLRCCVARRVLAGERHVARDVLSDATYDVGGTIDRDELLAWLARPLIRLCSHCSHATADLRMEPWRTTRDGHHSQ